MRRLVWPFASRTYHIVGNLMSQLKYIKLLKRQLQQMSSVFVNNASNKTCSDIENLFGVLTFFLLLFLVIKVFLEGGVIQNF